MKKIYEFLASKKLTLILLLIVSTAIAIATFVEEAHSTETAKTLIYSARWFELLLLFMVINLIAVMIAFKVGIRNKPGAFIIHIGFIVMLLGAVFTRYVGYEGVMHIREGKSSNVIHSYSAHFMAKSSTDSTVFEVNGAKLSADPFSFELNTPEGPVRVSFKEYIPRAVMTIKPDAQNGKEYIEVYTANAMESNSSFIETGESIFMQHLPLSFEGGETHEGIHIHKTDSGFVFHSSERLITATQKGEIQDTLEANALYPLVPNLVYNLPDQVFIFLNHFPSGRVEYSSHESNRSLQDVIIVETEHKDKVSEAVVTGGKNYIAQYNAFQANGTEIQMAYGIKNIELPFSLYLEDFILERYPGSMSPKSYESKVILKDERKGLEENHHIFMNNVLDYGGYRFFQSSYDQDEKGTILSVSYDFLGKWVTYISYFMLGIGFIITFFRKNSRINILRKRIKAIHTERKSLTVILFLIFGSIGTAGAQQQIVAPEQTKAFSELIVQSFDGRFEPVHTLATDVIHKIAKRHSITTEEKGKLTAMEAYIDMMLDPNFWRNQRIIHIPNEPIMQMIGINGQYASFNDFFTAEGSFKLAMQSETAFRKNAEERTKLDKEIMKVNERLNILAQTFSGDMLRIFPGENLENFKWIAPTDTMAFRPIRGKLSVINEDLQLQPFTYNNMFIHYISALREGKKNGNYERADRILNYMKSIQRQSTAAHILPSETKLKMEIHYNKVRIFTVLKFVYMILSVILLILTFTENLKAKPSKLLKTVINIFIVVLGLAFLFHTYGMGLRWYIAGHAPWSNGYESLILVAWGAALIGLLIVKYSRITTAATAFLAFLVMLVAGFSSYDPQLTPLVPVLDSYWLIIHVAAMVVSYAFFGLGFILGIINLLIYLFKKEHNKLRLNLILKELTNINELMIQIGLFLAVAGTFLGAIWANESWGRYWGWDAKETWALIILFVYAIVTHMRHQPKLNDALVFNIASVIGFASVLMTFFGVNYYLTKGMHSYAGGDRSIFPFYAWVIIFAVLALIAAAVIKEKYILKDKKIPTK